MVLDIDAYPFKVIKQNVNGLKYRWRTFVCNQTFCVVSILSLKNQSPQKR